MTTAPDFTTQGLLVFSPDATVTRLYRTAVQTIQSFDLVVAKWCWLRINETMVSSLYAKNRANDPHSPLHHLVDELFGLDYSLICLVKPDQRHPLDVVAFLSEIKGKSDPTICDRGSIRGTLNAPNKIMNYLHTSDSVEEAKREFGVLCGGIDHGRFCGRDLEADISGTEPEDLGNEASVVASFRLNRLKRECAAKLLPVEVSPLSRLIDEEAHLLSQCNLSPTGHERLGIVANSQREVLSELAASGLDVELLLALMETPDSAERVEELCQFAATHDVEVDSWDRLSLMCQSYQKG